jgi:hypothetical protein
MQPAEAGQLDEWVPDLLHLNDGGLNDTEAAHLIAFVAAQAGKGFRHEMPRDLVIRIPQWSRS